MEQGLRVRVGLFGSACVRFVRCAPWCSLESDIAPSLHLFTALTGMLQISHNFIVDEEGKFR